MRGASTRTHLSARAIGLETVVSFLLDRRLEPRGAQHTAAEAPSRPHVVRDGRLITGQNPASVVGTAEAFVAALRGE